MKLTDDYVRDQIIEAREQMGLVTFWHDPEKVYGIGKALVYLLARYSGKWEGVLEATVMEFGMREVHAEHLFLKEG